MPRKTRTAAEAANAAPEAAPGIATTGIPATAEFERIAEAGQRSLAALAELHARSVRDAMKFNAELMGFAQRRISADIQTSDRLARCRTVSEAMDALGDFYQGAFRDYAEETTALVRLGSAMSSETAEELVAEARRISARKDG